MQSDMSYIINTLIAYNDFFIMYTIANNGIYLVLIILSFIHQTNIMRRVWYMDYYKALSSSFTPQVSILIPCYNEEKTIVENVEALMTLEYETYEIIVINDGSKDNSLQNLIDAFELKKVDLFYKKGIETKPIRGIYVTNRAKNIVVIDKENGGKADALNVGINFSKYPLFVAIDADTIIDKNSLLRLSMPFFEDYEKTVAASGVVMIVNGCKVDKGFIEKVGIPDTFMASFQVVEYMRAFLSGRMGWSLINGMLIVSGAFGMFKKEAVMAVGGYSADTIGEDMELIIKLHKYMRINKRKYRITFLPNPVCWTQCPEDLRSLYNQRKRWQHGLMDSLITHRSMLFNPRYGVIGLFAMPYYFIFEMLEPLVAVTGYLIFIVSLFMGLVDSNGVLFFSVSVLFFGLIISISSVMLGEYTFSRYERISDFLKLVLYSIIENFGYRQLNTIMRVIALLKYRYKKNQWGTIDRKSFDKQHQNFDVLLKGDQNHG